MLPSPSPASRLWCSLLPTCFRAWSYAADLRLAAERADSRNGWKIVGAAGMRTNDESAGKLVRRVCAVTAVCSWRSGSSR